MKTKAVVIFLVFVLAFSVSSQERGNGASTYFTANENAPMGSVSSFEYFSRLLNSRRRAMVYTPPRYDSVQAYPLLILQHGGGGSETSWVNGGQVQIILDLLINNGKAVPMIVVMPNGNVDYPQSAPAGIDGMMKVMTPESGYPTEIADNLLPALAKKYPFIDAPETTAIAGLSMGGLDAFATFVFGKKRFGYYGVFSGGLLPAMQENMKTVYAAWLKREVLNEKRSLWIACGGADIAYPGTLETIKILQANRIEFEFRQNDFSWDHNWPSWRNNLYEFAQKLFK